MDAPEIKRIFEGANHRLLTDEIRKCLGTIFARKNAIIGHPARIRAKQCLADRSVRGTGRHALVIQTGAQWLSPC